MEDYRTIRGTATGEYEEKKSRFIASLSFADSEEAAVAFLEQVRAANRSLTPERVAVMASLQIAFDSLAGRLGQLPVDEATVSRVAALRMKCDEALEPALES